jgi:hypothetical protein
MKTETLNIPFSITFNPDDGFAYTNDLNASVYASSPNNAKSKLRPLVTQQIADALTHVRNRQTRVLGCACGEVLIVNFRYGSWGYDIAGPGRNHCASCSGFNSLEEAIEKAHDHANQVWGGVAWQC